MSEVESGFRRLLELTDKSAREELNSYYIISESRMDNYLNCLEDGAKQIAELRAQLSEAQGEIERLKNYADKLATGFPEGMLPKDIELLKESNAAMASDIESMGKGHPYPYVTPAKVIF